jgi:hypothetical protein
MMNMRTVQEKIKIRHLTRHDQEHHRPRQDERYNETEQGPARQSMRRLRPSGMFNGHLYSFG